LGTVLRCQGGRNATAQRLALDRGSSAVQDDLAPLGQGNKEKLFRFVLVGTAEGSC